MEHSAKFCRLETIRDVKKFYYYHSNIYKSYDDFENLKGMAWRLGLYRPIGIWNENGCNLVNFKLEICKGYQNLQKKIFQIIWTFHSHLNRFWVIHENTIICSLTPPHPFVFMGRDKLMNNRILVNNSTVVWYTCNHHS